MERSLFIRKIFFQSKSKLEENDRTGRSQFSLWMANLLILPVWIQIVSGSTTLLPPTPYFVACLLQDLSEDDIVSVVSAFGTIKSCQLTSAGVPGRHKGYGYIEDETLQSALVGIILMLPAHSFICFFNGGP